jgi:hypothetical protein
MAKVVSFFKKNYKVLVPVMAMCVLFITLLFLYREYKYDSMRNKTEISVFQYFSGVRVDYKAIVTSNLKNEIVDIEAKNKTIDNNTVPIYYDDMSKIIFPVEMTIVFPLRNGGQFKLYKYASYYNVDDVHFISNNIEEGSYSDFFLYDGKGVFFFPDDTVLKLNGEDYIELGSMSYVQIVGGYTLIYYDTTSGASEAIELEGRSVSVVSEYLDINVSEKYFYSFSNKILLHTPNNLNPV